MASKYLITAAALAALANQANADNKTYFPEDHFLEKFMNTSAVHQSGLSSILDQERFVPGAKISLTGNSLFRGPEKFDMKLGLLDTSNNYGSFSPKIADFGNFTYDFQSGENFYRVGSFTVEDGALYANGERPNTGNVITGIALSTGAIIGGALLLSQDDSPSEPEDDGRGGLF